MIQTSLKKNAVLNMIKALMSLIFPLITFPYTSRILGPICIGRVNFAQSIVGYFSLIAALGINTYGIREASKIRDNKDKLSEFVNEIFLINLISMIFAYILFAMALFFIPQLSEYRKLLCITASSILFTTIGINWFYSAIEEFKYITIRSIIFQFISLILLFSLVHNQDDYLWYAAISVISSAGSNICNFIRARKFICFKIKINFSSLKHLKPIFALFTMNAATSIYNLLDTTMLGFICGDKEVGIYSAATKINRIVIMMISAAISVLLPRLSYYAQKENNYEFKRIAENAFEFIILLSIPCIAGLIILAEPIILLFSGNSYLSAVPVMKIISPVIIIINISGLIGIQIFMAIRKEKLTLISVICGAVFNFFMNLLLINKYGATGAAIATLVAESVVTLIQIIFAKDFFNWKNILICLLQTGISTFIMSISIIIIIQKVHLPATPILAIIEAIMIYFVCLYILKNRQLCNIIKQFIPIARKN